MIKDEEFLTKYNKICDRVSNSIKQGFDGKPVNTQKQKYIKVYKGKTNTNFMGMEYHMKFFILFVYEKF